MAQLTKLSSVVVLTTLLCACSHKSETNNTALSPAAINLLKESRANMIYVPGDTYTMGEINNAGQLFNLGAHQVTLSGFYISKDNVSYGEYDAYTKATGQPSIDAELLEYHDFSRAPNYPVPDASWYQAHDYCAWLAENTGLPYALPTEAQWEYVARNKGNVDWPYPTENGQLELGKNFPSFQQLTSQPQNTGGIVTPLPIGSIPCTPMGICGLAGQVGNWVNDWYQSNYDLTTVDNPQGPATGTQKVVRGGGGGTAQYENSFERAGQDPSSGNGFRCVINSSAPPDQLGAFAAGYPR